MSSENPKTLVFSNKLEIIDMALFDFNAECEKSLKAFGNQIRKAIYEKGYVILINHGISETKIQKAWKNFDKFLELPLEKKEIYKRKPNCYTGYYPPGIETLDKSKHYELRHSFNITGIVKEHIPGEFYNEVYDLFHDYKALSCILLKSMALALDKPKNFFIDKHAKMLSKNVENLTTVRLLYYPPISDNITDIENYTRCGSHKDYGTFTLLSQDSEGGLQIKLPRSEEWQTVGHLPGSIFMNCGQLFEFWTNTQYPAVSHRVIIPEDKGKKNNGRHSIGFFVNPDNKIKISSNDIPFSNKNSSSSKEKSYTAEEYLQMLVTESLGFY